MVWPACRMHAELLASLEWHSEQLTGLGAGLPEDCPTRLFTSAQALSRSRACLSTQSCYQMRRRERGRECHVHLLAACCSSVMASSTSDSGRLKLPESCCKLGCSTAT